MINPLVRLLALAAFAGLASTAALAARHGATCSRSFHDPAAAEARGQVPQLCNRHGAELASAKERRQRGPRISWQAVA